MDNLQLLQKIIKESDNIVFFGGAGVSTGSGIPDFRSNDGLYSTNYGNFSPEEILSRDFFYEYPEEFYKFFREKMIYLSAKPNITHQTLAKLESMGKLKGVITQNIDGLHQAAGSQNVVELHGSIHRYRCNCCDKDYTLDDILGMDNIPTCDKNHIIKPDVVLYDEALKRSDLEKARQLIENADTLIVGGTSLTVFPAAKLVESFSGSNFVIINNSPTPYDEAATLTINEDINATFDAVNNSLNQDNNLEK